MEPFYLAEHTRCRLPKALMMPAITRLLKGENKQEKQAAYLLNKQLNLRSSFTL